MIKRNIKKVVLINPPMRIENVYGEFSEWGSVSPPTGLCYIAAYLRDREYDVEIIDSEAMHWNVEETTEAVFEKSPDVVGLSCKTLWVVSAHNVAQALKQKRPDLPIVVGGHHVTALPEKSLEQFRSFDAIVLGEGELTFRDYLEALINDRDLSGVAGLAYRSGDGIVVNPPRQELLDINSLPKPAFDLLPDLATHYNPSLINAKKLPAFPLITSRGCPSHCAFCDRSVFKNRTRIPSAEYTFSLIEDLCKNHGIRHFLFDDDNLLIKKEIFTRLFELIINSRLNFTFTCQTRVNTLDKEVLKLLKAAGCWQLMFGIESGSQRMLDAMKKGITLQQTENAVSLTRQAGIKTFGMFIIGFPGETEESLKETERFIKTLKLDDIGCFLFTPLPGSEVYENVNQYGTYNEDWEKGNSMEHALFIPNGLNEKIMKEYLDKFNNACYFNIRQIVAIPRRFTSMAHIKATLKSIPKVFFPKKI
jgi:anaerobic magnesium-protoporphyrin IX monomethyl ester cyclase